MRPLAAFLFMLLAASSAQAQSEAAKALAGAWEMTNAARDRVCQVTLSLTTARGGSKVEFDANCGNLFPLVKDITAWKLPEGDLLYLVDAGGKALVEFSEVETGIFEAPTPGVGVLFLQKPGETGPVQRTPDQVAGEWALMQGGETLCGFTLSNKAVPEGLALTVKPGCNAAVAQLNIGRWQVDRGELLLLPSRGNAWRFEEIDPDLWRRVPESADPVTLQRQ